jgi:hypothetical protein
MEKERKRLMEEDEGMEWCFQVEYRENGVEKGVFIFAKDYISLDALNHHDGFCSEIGRFLTRLGENYAEFGFANTASAMVPMGTDGGRFRIYNDGRIVFPELKWP